jgi:hypothetical protein
VFLGENLLALLLLALGAALAVGNLLAALRPPSAATRAKLGESAVDRAPLGRSLIMSGLGVIIALWAIASLIKG